MRWSYLIPRVVIVALLWTFFVFAFDPLLRRAMIYSGQSLAGAKVEIDDVDTKFFPPRITVHDVQVANRKDPWRNLFQVDEFHLSLEGKPLLRKSVVIEDGRITGLQWNTPRETSGELTDEELETSNKYAQFIAAKAREIGGDWYDDFVERMRMQLDPTLLKSVKLTKQLKNEWTQRFESYEKRLKGYEQRIKQIEQTAKNAKGSTFQKIEAYRKAINEANRLLADVNRVRTELTSLPQTANTDFVRIDNARKEDQQDIQRKFETFRHPDAETLTHTLLGPTIQKRLDQAAEWTRWAKDKADKFSKKGPEPKRMRGTFVKFKLHGNYPKFLVKKLQVSGKANWNDEVMPFEGTITGITTDPKLYGKPTVLQISGKATRSLDLMVKSDFTTETPAYQLKLAVIDPTTRTFPLGDKKKMKLAVAADKTAWNADIQLVGDTLAGHITVQQSPVHVISDRIVTTRRNDKPGKLDFNVERMMQTALSEIREIKATVVLSGTYSQPKFELQSDLGTQVADGINRMIRRELSLKQQQLTGKMNEVVTAHTQDLAKHLNGRYGSVMSQLQLQQGGVQKLIQRLAGGGNVPGNLNFNGLFRR